MHPYPRPPRAQLLPGPAPQEPMLSPPPRWANTSVARASDDFFPRDLASSTPHIAACAYNSAFIGALAMPDWDMFHSQHAVRRPPLPPPPLLQGVAAGLAQLGTPAPLGQPRMCTRWPMLQQGPTACPTHGSRARRRRWARALPTPPRTPSCHPPRRLRGCTRLRAP
jgi:hypothetical protein